MTQVRAIATQALRRLQARPPSSVPAEQAHRQLIVDDIKRFLEQGMDLLAPGRRAGAPPGAPIGDTGMDYLLGLDRCFVRKILTIVFHTETRRRTETRRSDFRGGREGDGEERFAPSLHPSQKKLMVFSVLRPLRASV